MGPAIRLYSGRGYVAMRDMTVTGIQRLSFPPLVDRGYRFNLALREEATGTLVQDLQDEGGDPLYYNLAPDVSNKLGVSRGGPDGWTWVLLSQDALWQPNCFTRTGTFHKFVKGQMISFGVTSRTSLSSEADEVYEELEIENRMERPLVLTLIPDQHASPRSACFVFISGGFQVTAVSDLGPAGSDGWRMEIPAKGQRTARIALLVQKKGQTVPPGYHAADLAARIGKGQAATRQLLRWASERLPRVDTHNKALDEFYRRSILTVLCCRWNRENFCTRPFYDFGQFEGCSVTWDLSFASEMLSILDPEGLKGTLLAHFRGGIANCTWLGWDGKGFGNYAQHPMAIMRILNDYMRQTGDVAVLDHVERGATLLEWMKRLGKEFQHQYARPDGLLDYGGDTMKMLEIRTSGYEHVVAATNAMAADYFRQLAQWCRTRNDPDAERFQQWAGQLQDAVNKTLWNEQEGWFDNLYPDGSRQLVLSYHQFDVLDGQTVSPGASTTDDRPNQGRGVPGALRHVLDRPLRSRPLGPGGLRLGRRRTVRRRTAPDRRIALSPGREPKGVGRPLALHPVDRTISLFSANALCGQPGPATASGRLAAGDFLRQRSAGGDLWPFRSAAPTGRIAGNLPRLQRHFGRSQAHRIPVPRPRVRRDDGALEVSGLAGRANGAGTILRPRRPPCAGGTG